MRPSGRAPALFSEVHFREFEQSGYGHEAIDSVHGPPGRDDRRQVRRQLAPVVREPGGGRSADLSFGMMLVKSRPCRSWISRRMSSRR